MRFSPLSLFAAAAAIQGAAAQAPEASTVVSDITSTQTTYTTTKTVFRIMETATMTRESSWFSTLESPSSITLATVTSAPSASAAWPTQCSNGTATAYGTGLSSGAVLPSSSSAGVPVQTINAASGLSASLPLAAFAGMVGFAFL